MIPQSCYVDMTDVYSVVVTSSTCDIVDCVLVPQNNFGSFAMKSKDVFPGKHLILQMKCSTHSLFISNLRKL